MNPHVYKELQLSYNRFTVQTNWSPAFCKTVHKTKPHECSNQGVHNTISVLRIC